MKNPEVSPDLSEADLSGVELSGAKLNEANLKGANLSKAKLFRTNFSGANLSDADLSDAAPSWANLTGANLMGAKLMGASLYEAELGKANLKNADLSVAELSKANLNGTNLKGANLSYVDLIKANLNNADLIKTNLTEANLSGADFTRASLFGANFSNADLKGANFSKAEIGWTTFAGVNLSEVKGLDAVKHHAPSSIGIDTIYLSQGKIPEIFLRRAGVPRALIEYIPDLVAAQKPIQFYSCFISYNHQDEEFTERLYADLQNKDVRCWKYTEDMKIGDELLETVDKSIRLRDKLLVVLSKNSINSAWVKDEVEIAFEEERRRGTTVLFPIRLDDAVLDTDKAWAAKVSKRHIGEFTNWKNHDEYKKAFDRLLKDLAAE